MEPILFIFNGLSKNNGRVGVSGGDIRLFEIIKNTELHLVNLLTTPNGMELLEKFNVKYSESNVIDYSIDSGIKSNLIISIKSFFQLPHKLRQFRGSVYSSCEHLYDVLPAFRLKILNKCKWYAVYHWVEDYPWKEKRGNTPLVRRYLYWLNRSFSSLIIKLFADRILAVSDQTRDKLIKIKKIKPARIKAVYCGVDYEKIKQVGEKFIDEKESAYDAIYMKRLNNGKGIFDLLEIWKLCCLVNPALKLAIIGDGPAEIVKKIHEFIKKNNFGNNIFLLGVIYDFEQKFRVLNSSKLFILPTHEENWAIVIGEAMAIKLPVLCYNLKEIFPIWKDNVEWIDFEDVSGFADRILSFLSSGEKRLALSSKAFDFIKKYDWREIVKNEFND
jgi:glycosyltransferase involved in cell wall biosynthesis